MTGKEQIVSEKQMKSEAAPEETFGTLHLSPEEAAYEYKGETYRLTSHPYEPCLYLRKGGRLVCTLHNAYTTETLTEVFAAGKTVKTNYAKDHDKEFDEAGFCRVLAAALDSGRDEMDLFDAAKLARRDCARGKR